MKAAEWIDRVKQKRGWESDYRVAKELGFRANTISQYRAHGTTLDDGIALKVAEALGEKPEIVLLDQAVERSRNDAARSALGKVLARLVGSKPRPLKGAGGAAVAAAGDERPAAVDITSAASIQGGKVRGPRNCARNIHRINPSPTWWNAIAAAIFPAAGPGQFQAV